MKTRSLLLLLAFVVFACSPSSEDSNSDLQEESTVHSYPAFAQFPEKQFQSIQLGESILQTITTLSNQSAIQTNADPMLHFYLPKDSTQLIIPQNETLDAFKVYLYSAHYCNNPEALLSFLSNKSQSNKSNQLNYSIFTFTSVSTPFKLTCFVQPNYIRLHFTRITPRG